MSAHKLGSIEKKNERIDNPQIQEIINKIEQLSDRIKQPSINTSHIITFNDDTAKVILPIKICEGCEMALVEFKSSENVNRGTIHVHASNVKNTFFNNEESQYIYSFFHNGGKIKQRPPALIYCPITEKFGSFIKIRFFKNNTEEIDINKFHLKFHIKNHP